MANSLLEKLTSHLEEGVLVCDDNGYVLYANRAAQALLTQTLDWMTTRSLDTWLRGRDGQLWPLDGKQTRRELNYQDINGREQWVNARISHLPVLGKDGWVVILQSPHGVPQRLAGIEAVTGGIARQLTEHLEVILENASKALLGDLTEEQAEPIRKILEAGQSAAILKRHLNAVAGEGGVLVKKSLCSVVRDCIPLFGSILGENLDLSFTLNEQDDWVNCDPDSIRLGLVHLAEWIGRHHTTKGNVEIEVLSPHGRSDRVRLRVADDGPSIDQSTIEKLFQPFAERKNHVGLPVVFGIMEQHHGRLLVQSEHREGTVFYLEFPKVSAPKKQSQRLNGAPNNETVFVVDDDPNTLEVVSLLLEQQGFKVITASNGIEASVVIRKQHHEIDLMLTDAVLPGRSGLELISEMRTLNATVPVILMSGYPAEFMGGQVKPDIPLLGKPFSPGTLVTRLRTLLGAPT
jgi:two-component system cell cycle sensor histidine kinase/response regulator CckA